MKAAESGKFAIEFGKTHQLHLYIATEEVQAISQDVKQDKYISITIRASRLILTCSTTPGPCSSSSHFTISCKKVMHICRKSDSFEDTKDALVGLAVDEWVVLSSSDSNVGSM